MIVDPLLICTFQTHSFFISLYWKKIYSKRNKTKTKKTSPKFHEITISQWFLQTILHANYFWWPYHLFNMNWVQKYYNGMCIMCIMCLCVRNVKHETCKMSIFVYSSSSPFRNNYGGYNLFWMAIVCHRNSISNAKYTLNCNENFLILILQLLFVFRSIFVFFLVGWW